MATNLDSRFLSAKYFLPAMRKKKWGRFIGISSNMVGLAIPGMSHYITSKMGLSGSCEVSQTTSQMMALRRTRRCPVSLIRSQRLLSRRSKSAPLGDNRPSRASEPEDVTGAILFLASDDAAFITLQAIVVDGGQHLIG
jgi:3-oxoacyl-[acyl-carrier protein] reductase